MKTIISTFTLLFALLYYSSIASAAPQSGGKVERLYINKAGTVLFRIGSPNALPDSCSDVNWPYEFKTTDTVGKEWLSLLLTAKAKDETINIGYIPQAGTTRCKVDYLFQ